MNTQTREDEEYTGDGADKSFHTLSFRIIFY